MGSNQHVKPGAPLKIPAGDWNDAQDAARHFKRTRDLPPPIKPVSRQNTLVRVRNDSGGDLERFAVLGIDAPLTEPNTGADADAKASSLLEFQNVMIFSGVTPTTEHAGKFVVLIEAIVDGQIGWAAADGLVRVQVQINDEDDDLAEVIDGEDTMLGSSGDGSAKILTKQPVENRDDPAIAWCTVRLVVSCTCIALYMTGFFNAAQAREAMGVNRWEGSAWKAFSSDPPDDVINGHDCAAFDPGYDATFDNEFDVEITDAHSLVSADAPFTAEMVGQTITVTGSSNGNDGDYEITAVPDGSTLVVAETLNGTFPDAVVITITDVAIVTATGDPFDSGMVGNPLVVSDSANGNDGDYAIAAFIDTDNLVIIGTFGGTFPDTCLIHTPGLSWPELYVVGENTLAGATPAPVLRWNGTAFEQVDDSAGLDVGLCAIVFQNQLVVGGTASTGTYVKAWDGTAWNVLGSGGPDGPVFALYVFDGNLYVGGSFELADGVTCNSIAKWDGAAWSAIDSGVMDGASPGFVYAIHAHDENLSDAANAVLFIAGHFDDPAAGTAANIARLVGGSWEPVGEGIVGSGEVRALATFDDGATRRLYAGGGGVDGSPMLRWDGLRWSAAGEDLRYGGNTPLASVLTSLVVWDDRLIATGGFNERRDRSPSIAGSGVFRRDFGGGVYVGLGRGTDGPALTLAVFDGKLLAGGAFAHAGTVAAARLAAWDESTDTWAAAGTGLGAAVRASIEFGGDLVLGGDFVTAAGVAADHLVKWTGAAFVPMGGVNGPVHALALDGGILLIGGEFTLHDDAPPVNANSIIAFDGALWSAMGDGFGPEAGDLNPIVRAIIVYGGDIYAAGRFVFANAGATTVNNIARWNGMTWDALGAGVNGEVRALCEFDGELYVAGAFTSADGITVKNIAKFDGTDWFAVQDGGDAPDDPINAMIVFDDGGGDLLYMGGEFGTIKTLSASAFATLSGSLDGDVLSFAAGDAGGGAMLYVGGGLRGAGTLTTLVGAMNRIATFDSLGWHTLGGGVGRPPDFNAPVYPESIQRVRILDLRDGPGFASNERPYIVGDYIMSNDVSTETVARLGHGGRFFPIGIGLRGRSTGDGQAQGGAMIWHNDGDGMALIVAGIFELAVNDPATTDEPERVPVLNIAAFRGGAWFALGDGLDGFTGAMVQQAGCFNHDAHLDDSTTIGADDAPFDSSMVGQTVTVSGSGDGNDGDYTIVSVDDSGTLTIDPPFPGMTYPDAVTITIGGNQLYCFGGFSDFVRRWDGTDWHAVGNLGSLIGTPNARAMVVFQDAIFIFGDLGGGDTGYIYDGQDWTPTVASVEITSVNDAIVADLDGMGDLLYAAGTANFGEHTVRSFDGSAWLDVGASLTGQVDRMCIIGTGTAKLLIVAGTLSLSGTPGNVFSWDGTTWLDITGDLPDQVIRDMLGIKSVAYFGGGIGAIGSDVAFNIAQYKNGSYSGFARGGLNYDVAAIVGKA